MARLMNLIQNTFFEYFQPIRVLFKNFTYPFSFPSLLSFSANEYLSPWRNTQILDYLDTMFIVQRLHDLLWPNVQLGHPWPLHFHRKLCSNSCTQGIFCPFLLFSWKVLWSNERLFTCSLLRRAIPSLPTHPLWIFITPGSQTFCYH